MQICGILQEDPQYAFVPAGANDEIEFLLVPRQWPVSKEGTKPPEPVFCVRSDSDDDSRTLEEPVERVAGLRCLTGLLGKVSHALLLWRRGSNCTSRVAVGTHHDVMLSAGGFPSEDGCGYTRDVCAECWRVLNDGDRSIRSTKKEQTQRRKRGGPGDSAIRELLD